MLICALSGHWTSARKENKKRNHNNGKKAQKHKLRKIISITIKKIKVPVH